MLRTPKIPRTPRIPRTPCRGQSRQGKQSRQEKPGRKTRTLRLKYRRRFRNQKCSLNAAVRKSSLRRLS